MKTITKEELNNILKLHKKWLNDEEGGIRADFRGVDFSGVDLRGANLRGINLEGGKP